MKNCEFLLLIGFLSAIHAFISGNIMINKGRIVYSTKLTNLMSVRDSVPAMNTPDFPILSQRHNGKRLVYLDSAASSHMPTSVRKSMLHYWETCHSNVNRASHRLSSCATSQYENARVAVKQFINANSENEIIFTSGATHALNLVALGFASNHLREGDEILVSSLEHHSNFIPWQRVANKTGATLKFVAVDVAGGCIDFADFRTKLTFSTKLVCVAHESNVLGMENPIKDIIAASHAVGAVVVVDACQSISHSKLDVQALNADFVVASGHKMCGPTGIGILYARRKVLEEKMMTPVFVGGGVADDVDWYNSKLLPPPHCFEAGTPPIAEAVGLHAACNYLQSIGMDKIGQHCKQLGEYLFQQLSTIPDVVVYGPPQRSSGLVSFTHKSIHPADISALLDMEGVCVRAGLHCAHPLHKILPFAERGTVRASAYGYNTVEDIDILVDCLKKALKYHIDRKK